MEPSAVRTFPQFEPTTLLRGPNQGERFLDYVEGTIPTDGQLPRFRIVEQNLGHELAMLVGLQDIELGQETFDGLYLIQGECPPAVVAVLSRLVLETLEEMETIRLLVVEHHRLRVRASPFPGEYSEAAFVLWMVNLARRMCAARDWLWRLEDRLDRGSPEEAGYSPLHGVLRGIPVTVRYAEVEGEWKIQVHASVEGPPGLRAAHIDIASRWPGERLSTHNPILDRLVGFQGANRFRLLRFLEHSGVLEGAMDVLHGLPGSTWTREGVTGLLPADTAELGPTIDRVVALAAAVKEAGPQA